METPVALTIAGSDNSAGAGIQADLKTFTHFKVYGLTVVTSVVAEVPGRVRSVQAVDPDLVRDQLELSLDSFPVAAAKTGMLYTRENIDTVCDLLEVRATERPFLVVDPVMVASAGDPLLLPDGLERYRTRLFPLAGIVTPNLDEASAILGEKIATLDAMREAVQTLYEIYHVPFLLKGGHLQMDTAIDLLFDANGMREFSEPYCKGISTHGTGCTYSAAIAANVARGLPLIASVGMAKKFVTQAIATSFRWRRTGYDLFGLRHF